jgi:hypothetical protein
MSAYQGRRVFRTSPGYMVIFVWAELMFLSGAVFTYRTGGWGWTSIGLTALSVLGLGGVLEGVVRRIVLADDALYVTDLWGRHRYSKSEIVRVEEAKGVPTTIRLTDGRVVPLPDLGHLLGNSLRAWLKHAS